MNTLLMNSPGFRARDHQSLIQTDLPADETLIDTENLSPGQKVQKELIERIFLKIDPSADIPNQPGRKSTAVDAPSASIGNDSIEISSISLEMLHRDQVSLKMESPNGTISIQAEHVEILRLEEGVSAPTAQKQADPLVIDLDGDGIELTDVRDGGTRFDIDADGRTDTVAWVQTDDAFLVLDRNKNGSIDNGAELFGDQHGAEDGFAELAKFDSDNNGKIDAQDEHFAAMKLWQDRNGDGRSSGNELQSLSDAGIAAIALENRTNRQETIAGNRLAASTAYASTNGVLNHEAGVAEVWLSVSA